MRKAEKIRKKFAYKIFCLSTSGSAGTLWLVNLHSLHNFKNRSHDFGPSLVYRTDRLCGHIFTTSCSSLQGVIPPSSMKL
uniref:Secreted protein n=1 Tax=Ascaris lumbricoides TaxID=6252 RepID=A0A0M3IR49_ASCLU